VAAAQLSVEAVVVAPVSLQRGGLVVLAVLEHHLLDAGGPVTLLQEGEHQVPVLEPQQVSVEAADPVEGGSSDQPQPADDRAIEHPVGIEGREVDLARPSAEVTHLPVGVGGALIGRERGEQPAGSVGRQPVVGVKEKQVGLGRGRGARVAGGRLAGVLLADDRHLVGQRGQRRLDLGVGGAVVHDDHPGPPGVLGERAGDRLPDELGVVVVGDDDGDVVERHFPRRGLVEPGLRDAHGRTAIAPRNSPSRRTSASAQSAG
jgi:hypothetical protein